MLSLSSFVSGKDGKKGGKKKWMARGEAKEQNTQKKWMARGEAKFSCSFCLPACIHFFFVFGSLFFLLSSRYVDFFRPLSFLALPFFFFFLLSSFFFLALLFWFFSCLPIFCLFEFCPLFFLLSSITVQRGHNDLF